jgi:hypothetical protein
LSKYFSNELSTADRNAWRVFSSTNPVVNRLGNTTFLTGQQSFAKYNAILQSFNIAIVDTPPVSTAISSVVDIDVAAVPDPSGSVTVTVNTTGLSADEHVMIWLSPPMNQGRDFISSQLRRVNGYWTGDTPQIVTASYKAAFGSLPTGPGQRIFARAVVVNISNGVTSGFMQQFFTWT